MPNLLNRKITFGGDEVPAKIASAPNIIRAERKMTVTSIGGTSREVVEMEDAWEPYDQPYRLFVGDGTVDSIQEDLDAVARVLYKDGWQILLDDYEPEYYRLAYYKGGFNADNRKTRVSVFDIYFRCRPERFLLTGSEPVPVASGGQLTNPTNFNARPLIHITGSGSGTLAVAGVTMSFADMVDYLNIDCEKMNVYRLPNENRNSLMTGDFPVLKSGSNVVSFTGGITSVTITPKWWTI